MQRILDVKFDKGQDMMTMQNKVRIALVIGGERPESRLDIVVDLGSTVAEFADKLLETAAALEIEAS